MQLSLQQQIAPEPFVQKTRKNVKTHIFSQKEISEGLLVPSYHIELWSQHKKLKTVR